MFKKTIAFAAAAVLALSMIATGCGKVEESSITMDMSDEKVATIEFSNANEEEFVQGGYLRVEEGEGIEVTSELNDDGEIEVKWEYTSDITPKEWSISYNYRSENPVTATLVTSDTNSVTLKNLVPEAEYTITVKNPNGKESGVTQVVVDGKPIDGNVIPYAAGKHTVEVTM